MFAYYVFLFCFGVIIGSFLNVVILRYGTKKSIVSDRSRCPHCGKILVWHELIPILSFVFQKGKCRGCKTKISWQYPLVELMTGVLFVSIANYELGIMNYDFNSLFLNLNSLSLSLLTIGYWLLIACFLVLIAVYDFHTQIIPNEFVYPFIVLSFLSWFLKFDNWNLLENWKLKIVNFLPIFFTGIILFLFFASLWFFSKGRAMGFGDAKLALGIGFLLGPIKGLIAMLLSFWSGALVGILLLFLNKKKYNMKSKLAFGPFLVFGALVALLLGDSILNLWILKTGVFPF